MNSTLHTEPAAAQGAFSRPAALIGGAAVLVAVTAVATTLAVRDPAPDTRAGIAAPMAATMSLGARRDVDMGTPGFYVMHRKIRMPPIHML